MANLHIFTTLAVKVLYLTFAQYSEITSSPNEKPYIYTSHYRFLIIY